uniref:Uncharacterized protein n=1 Tax=Steinernema glaseri TaxID=37863 RepID=A0A1I8AJI9_9BILA
MCDRRVLSSAGGASSIGQGAAGPRKLLKPRANRVVFQSSYFVTAWKGQRSTRTKKEDPKGAHDLSASCPSDMDGNGEIFAKKSPGDLWRRSPERTAFPRVKRGLPIVFLIPEEITG